MYSKSLTYNQIRISWKKPRWCQTRLKSQLHPSITCPHRRPGKVGLTLIRAAGGVYDFRNFEEVYLCNSSSSDLLNSCIPRKTSREYILLNTLERKTAFSAIYRPKRARNRPVFSPFFAISYGCEGIYDLSTTTPGPGTPPANSWRTKQFWSRPCGL